MVALRSAREAGVVLNWLMVCEMWDARWNCVNLELGWSLEELHGSLLRTLVVAGRHRQRG